MFHHARIRRIPVTLVLCACACLTAFATTERAAQAQSLQPIRLDDGRIQAGDKIFDNWIDYHASDLFNPTAKRCGTDGPTTPGDPRSPSDCGLDNTNPTAAFDPSVVKYRIPVVVHVIQNTSGDGFVTESGIRGQIEILNEDFLAIPGSNGENGNDVQIEFFLATKKPDGSPTNGIDYKVNNTWFFDDGNYWNTLAWDTHRYLNVYTNDMPDPSLLGYVPEFPAEGIVGTAADRVVIRWQVFGSESPDPINNLGRTLTHEVGHYLGLYHTFHDSCTFPGPPQCYQTGDRICDTPPESEAHFGCVVTATCSSPDDNTNYMNYSDDNCMTHFTPEQVRRMRCTLENYRPSLYFIANPTAGACCQLDGACTIRSAADCAASGGLFRGQGITCASSTCSINLDGGESCASAPHATSSFFDSGSTAGKSNDYNNTSATCGNLFGPQSGAGPDIVYELTSPGGGTISVVLTPDNLPFPAESPDLAVYAITNCGNPGGSCVGGDDRNGEGGIEQFTFTAAAGTPYYIIVDGFAGSAGGYQLSVTVSGGPTGACCMTNGGCSIGAEGSCIAFGGTYHGNGSVCATANCPEPDPTGSCCDDNGICSILTETQCTASGGSYGGDFTGCNPNPCADPFGICCAPNDSCSENFRAACEAAGGTFGGPNTSCNAAATCSEIIGACCMLDGSCGEMIEGDCLDLDGVFKGYNAMCATTACPQPTGACCLSDGPCELRTRSNCENAGGDYKGDVTSCGGVACVQSDPTGACCSADGTCESSTQTDCTAAGRNYRGDFIVCAAGLCPEPTGACCFGGGACSLIALSACNGATGVFAGAGTNCTDGCTDQCFDDPDKTAPGECGCGIPDTDSDGDGTVDCHDDCPEDARKITPGTCGCGFVDAPGCPVDPPAGNNTECCGGGAPAALPFMLTFWMMSRRRRRRIRRSH